MQNYVQRGETVTLAAPYDVLSGGCLMVGSIVGVATTTALTGENVETVVTGVFDLGKVSAQAWSVGDRIYFDATAKLATNVSTGNSLIGVALVAAANPSPTGRVRLNGSF